MTLSAIEKNPPRCVMNFVNQFEAIEQYRTLYRDITMNGVVLQYNDRHALGMLAVIMLEVEILTLECYERGDAMEVQGDRNMITKKNPARDALEKVRPKMIQLMKEFKMTPGSRKAVAAPGGSGSDEDDEFNDF